ncbi:hypothetical protein BurJ1DRAFT_3276 [Burkholderiales bacterium JOSHI_001]|nr:hypothetical protein BurJ1DRAFT_3276 [Burkholderiales bacterium JOSHI_001]
MRTSFAKEATIVASAIVAGLVAVYAYQNYSELLRHARELFTLNTGDSISVNKAASVPRKEVVRGSSGSASAAPLAEVPVAPAKVASSSETYSAASQSSPAGPQQSSVGHIQPATQSERLVGEIRQVLKDDSSNRWTNVGIGLWRDCRRHLAQDGRYMPSPQLVEACNHLLADAILTLRASESRPSREAMAVAKELRADRMFLSPFQIRELDRIIGAGSGPVSRASIAASQSTGK